MSKSGIMRWNRFRNFEATYLANPGILGTAIEVGVVYLQTGNESGVVVGVALRVIEHDRVKSG